MEEMLPMRSTPTLIDAHSFVWIIQGDAFENWKRDNESGAEIEEYIEKNSSRRG